MLPHESFLKSAGLGKNGESSLWMVQSGPKRYRVPLSVAKMVGARAYFYTDPWNGAIVIGDKKG